MSGHRRAAPLAVAALTASLLVGIVAPGPTAADNRVQVSGDDLVVSDEVEYRAALAALSSDPTGPLSITLGADITLDDGGDPTYSGVPDLLLDGDGHSIDAGGTSGILFHNSWAALTVRDLTLTGASRPTELGGAVAGGTNAGVVTIENSTFTDNHAGAGGAVGSWQSYVVRNSTFTGNTALLDGGALASNVDLEVSGSTFTGNEAANFGGAVGANSVLTVVNSTISGNSANIGGGLGSNTAINLDHVTVTGNTAPQGANIRIFGTLTPFASVVSDPLGGGANCAYVGGTTPPAASGGYNWSDDTSCGLTGTDDTQDGVDPRLGPVRDNGGTTPTMFPLWDSPLRDAIPNASCSATLTADQRGITRPHPTGGNCDIGAVEAVYPPHAFADVPAWVDSAVRWITSTVNDPPLMTGITPTTFEPNDPITRAQVARAKYRFAGEADTTGYTGHPFGDVPPWVTQAIDWTWQHQLMTGITPTTFKPNDNITRAQVTRLDERLGLSPWAWNDPTTAPHNLPFRPDTP